MKRHLQFGLGMGLLFSLLVTACGGGSDQPAATATANPTGTSASSTATRVAPTVAPTATQAARPTPTAAVSAGEVNVALTTLGNFVLNPGVAGDNLYTDAMDDHLIGTDPDGNLQPESGFVTSWSTNADSTIWTVKVRDNLVFHNGDKATSKDAAYTLELSIDPKAPYSRAGDLRRSISKLETPDDSTLVITLTGTDIYWHITWLGKNPPNGTVKTVLPRNYSTTVGTDGANKAPVGTGPYKFKSVTVGDRIVTEAAGKHFFFGVPKTRTLTFLNVAEEQTRMGLLTTGAADLAPITATNETKAKQSGLSIVLKKDYLITAVWSGQYPDVISGYGPNPLVNENVRKALFFYAIDRKALVDSFLGGKATVTMDFGVSTWDITGAFTPLPIPPYDPAKSKALLAEAGYAKGFELDAYVVPNSTPGPEAMEAVIVYWENLGIKVNRLNGAVFSAALAANYNKAGFPKPTVYGLSIAGNQAINSGRPIGFHNPLAIFSLDRDPEGLRLGTEFLQAKTVDAYKKAGEAYRQWSYEHAKGWAPLFSNQELWARSNKISASWRMGRDPYYRLGDAAALP